MEKKKIQIDKWFDNHKIPNVESFNNRGEDYVKISIFVMRETLSGLKNIIYTIHIIKTMTFDYSSFLHFVFVGFVALFPVINPLGSAFIVSPYFTKLPKKDKIKAIKQVAFYAFGICLFTLITGHWILELFGLSIPVIQLAGGIMICKIGWDFLTPAKEDKVEKVTISEQNLIKDADIGSKLFYPITFPITTGAGTISVLFTLSAHGSDNNIGKYIVNNIAIMIAVTGLCILIFLCYFNANKLINYLGSQGEKIVNSVMAFLIFCVGLQIAVEGITQLIQPLMLH